MELARYQANDIYRQLEGDLETLFKLVFTYRTPVTEADSRLASVILRKWLVEGLLGRLCNFIDSKPTFFALDNSAVLKEIEQQPSIKYFLTGGVRLNGNPVMGIMHSSAPFSGQPLLPAAYGMKEKELSLGEFVNQRRIYFNGVFLTCADIIKFTANKLGGAHADYNRTGKNAVLQDAAYYLMIGGPIPGDGDIPGEIYLPLEPEGSEFLSGFHIEIVAAATSLIQVRINGNPVMKLDRRKSLRTRWREFLRKDAVRYIIRKLSS
jgi:hypothetical protein